ncbi:MAG: hypothetical protein AB1813_06360 [Verrucomicrobiota bacterium]
MIDLEGAVVRTSLVPREKVASLLAALKKVPEFGWLLTAPHAEEHRLQGDLLADFPVALIAPDGRSVSKRFAVMILNNTCDLQPKRSSFVNVAPVIDFEEFTKAEIAKRGEDGARSYLHDIRSNRVLEMLWLPPFHTFRHGAIVFLDRIGTAAIQIYEHSLGSNARLASLSQNGFYYFLIKITTHLARAESAEVRRDDSS